MGKDKLINGSKVLDILLQRGHTKVDLYYPTISSYILLEFLNV